MLQWSIVTHAQARCDKNTEAFVNHDLLLRSSAIRRRLNLQHRVLNPCWRRVGSAHSS